MLEEHGGKLLGNMGDHSITAGAHLLGDLEFDELITERRKLGLDRGHDCAAWIRSMIEFLEKLSGILGLEHDELFCEVAGEGREGLHLVGVIVDRDRDSMERMNADRISILFVEPHQIAGNDLLDLFSEVIAIFMVIARRHFLDEKML